MLRTWFSAVFGSDVEFEAELLVGSAAGNELEDFTLPLGQRVRVGRLGEPSELSENQRRQRGREDGFAGRSRPERLGEIVDRHRLEQVTGSTRRDRIEEIPLGLTHREDDDRAHGGALLDDGQPAAAGHVQVAHHEVGAARHDDVDRSFGVVRLSDHLEAGGKLRPQP